MKNTGYDEKQYYLGVDIGTDSVGYAVTDENYNIIKFHGKAMWGSRLFDEAKTAADRRGFRSNRRRLSRRKQRIELLQELFAAEISKIDAGFYQRLKDSTLLPEDKAFTQTYSLFSDKLYSDIDYHRKFPTIYHLRKELIVSEEKHDIRLIYLALHHIMKYRGHFLFTGSFDNAVSLPNIIENFKGIIKELYDVTVECIHVGELERVLRDKHISKKDKVAKVLELLSFHSDKDKISLRQKKEIIKLICGLKAKLVDIFDDSSLKEIENPSISFAESAYEEIQDSLHDILDDRMVLIEAGKALYDWSVLADILEGGEYGEKAYLSVAKVKKYEKHQNDLQLLKELIKGFNKATYREMFHAPGKNNYAAYIGHTKQNGRKKPVKRCTSKEFFDYLKKLLKQMEDAEYDKEKVMGIQREIESGTFLPLHRTKDNGVIPYQVHEMELNRILANAETHYPFLREMDSSGKTVSEKIKSIFTFRIPYYVGPLNTLRGSNAWMIRKNEGKIYPWNFEEQVDVYQSAQKFIRRMTNKCTYLYGKDVLPKNSLLYSEFMVWNELNNVKIGIDKLALNTKKKVVEVVFKHKKKVKGEDLKQFLRSEGIEFDDTELSGFDGNFKASLTSYLDMKKIFGEELEKYSVQCMAEQLILWITLYGEDSSMLKNIIRKEYSKDVISEQQLKKLCQLKYQGWGRLSKEFLTEIEGSNKETGELFSIIGALRETSDNLMQLLSSRYTFSEVVNRKNNQENSLTKKISYDTIVKDLIVSPSVKRAIWQVVLIAEEIKKIMKKEPSKIFIEVARGAEEKKRTVSRKDQLIQLYDKIEDESREWKKELEDTEESKFRSIKLYLYYTQMGRCMYSGERIELSSLADTTIYDRDHIYPQSKTKDDSLDNLVLVRKDINAGKGNEVLSSEIRQKMRGFWKGLKDKKLISEVKYQRLMRSTPFTDEELAGFINRQLVETRQSTKMVADLFQRLYQEAEIVYVKAAAVSEFRKKELDMVKVRSLNDYHHAKDAYLNIVVGNVYHEKFTKNPLEWLKKNPEREYSLNRMFSYDIIKNGKVIWKRGKEGSLAVVRKNIMQRDIQYTRYATENKSGQNGGFFDQNMVGKTNNPSVPIKQGMDMKKYGGYKTITPAYFALVESEDKKGRKQRSIEAVPLYLKEKIEEDMEIYLDFCRRDGLKNPKILIPKIKKDSYLNINGFPMHLRGTTGKQLSLQGAVQLTVTEETEQYLKKIEKYIQGNTASTDKNLLKVTEYNKLTKEENLQLYDELCRKQKDTIYQYRPANQYNNLVEWRDKFIELAIEEQCIILNEILHLLQCKPLTANFSLLGGGRAGNIQVNKVLTNCKSAKIIYQSNTGLFQKEIDLLTIGQEDDLPEA